MILIYPSRIYHDIGLHKPKLCPSIFLGEIPSSQLDLLLKLPLKDLSFHLFFFKPEHDIIVHVARTLALQLAIVRHTIKSKRWVRIISASWGKWLPTNYSKVESTILKRNLLEWNKGNFFGFNNWTIFCFSNPAAWDISQWGWPFSFCQFCALSLQVSIGLFEEFRHSLMASNPNLIWIIKELPYMVYILHHIQITKQQLA